MPVGEDFAGLVGLVSGGTQGRVSLSRPNALLRTRIRVRSRALAAPRGTRSSADSSASSSFLRRGIWNLT